MKKDTKIDITRINGFLIINKEKNMTSFDVIRKLKKRFKISKIGHTGTLDPQTTGVLVICLGRATKLIDFISTNSFKEYRATMQVGIETTTYDMAGEKTEEKKTDIELLKRMTDQEIGNYFKKFIGKYKQIPPGYSAKKINGERAYKLYREGEQVKLSPKTVEVYNIKIEHVNRETGEITFIAKVSKGTYIRSLIVDVAGSMGMLATMTFLTRLQTDGFSIENSRAVDKVASADILILEDYLKKINILKYNVEKEDLKYFENGLKIKDKNILKKIELNGPVMIYNDNELITLYEKKENSLEQILKIKI